MNAKLLSLACLIALTGCLEKMDSQSGSDADDGDKPSTENSSNVSTNPNWMFVGPAKVNASDGASSASMTSFNNKIYAIWHEPVYGKASQVQVAVFNDSNNGEWTNLAGANGLNRMSTKDAYFGRLFVFNSKLYACWQEYNSSPQIRIAVYNGNDSAPSWDFVDGGGTNGLNWGGSTQNGLYPVMAELNGKLYVSWREAASISQIRVAVFNGNDSAPVWSFVDGNGSNGLNFNPLQGATAPQLITYNSKLYLSWTESITPNGNAGNVIHLSVYNGNDSAPSWSFVDGNSVAGLNVDGSRDARAPQMTIFNSQLYLGWSENGVDGYSSLRLKVYNGDDSAPSWSFVDGNAAGIRVAAGTNAYGLRFSEHSSQLLISWLEDPIAGSLKTPIRVLAYNSNDSAPAWNTLGTSGEPINCTGYKGASGAELLSFNGDLFAISAQQCPVEENIRFEKYVP